MDSLVAPVLRKHQIPEWAGEYIREYIKANVRKDPIGTIKRGISFIETGRNKGAVTRNYVKLPNGTTFNIALVGRILSLFLYGEERISEIESVWAKEKGPAAEYAAHFGRASENSAKHARAIKNAISGIGRRQVKPSREMSGGIRLRPGARQPRREDGRNRDNNALLILNFRHSLLQELLRVVAEFMRSFGKAFKTNEEIGDWTERARGILSTSRIPEQRVYALAVETLSRIFKSIESESPMAKEAGIQTEAALLRDISIAYPLHVIKECIPAFDIEACLDSIHENCRKKGEMKGKG